MISKNQLAIINRALKDINNTSTIFGGKIIILGGDFRQTLPIVSTSAEKTAIIANCIQSS